MLIGPSHPLNKLKKEPRRLQLHHDADASSNILSWFPGLPFPDQIISQGVTLTSPSSSDLVNILISVCFHKIAMNSSILVTWVTS